MLVIERSPFPRPGPESAQPRTLVTRRPDCRIRRAEVLGRRACQHPASAALRGSLSPGRACSRQDLVLSLRSVLTPRDPYDECIEDREQDDPDREPRGELVDLVDDEDEQQSDHPRVGPELVAQDETDENHLRHAMGKEIDSAVNSGPTRELTGGVQQVASDEVGGILSQFVGSERSDDAVDRARRHEQEGDAADDFEETVESLERDTNPEGTVQPPGSGHLGIIASRRRARRLNVSWELPRFFMRFTPSGSTPRAV